jgi:hypothetical protein
LVEPAHRRDSFERSMAWFDRYLRVENEPPTGRVGEVLWGEEWSVLVRSAERVDELGGARTDGGFLVVDFVLTSETPVEGHRLRLTGDASPFVLVDGAGRRAGPVGVPVEWPGGSLLLVGEQTVALSGSPAENDASWPLRVAFDLENRIPPAAFQVMDLPAVEIRWPAPRERLTPSDREENR